MNYTMGFNDINKKIEYLKEYLLRYEPENLILSRIHSVKDIYEYRKVLKQIKSNEIVVDLISDLILKATNDNRRFRTLECLTVLKSLVRQLPENIKLKKDSIDKLFEIYKYIIFSRREEIKWCVSVIIKNKKLDGKSINWLIDNHNKSDHILNRLLLYPYRNSEITSWAKQAYIDGKYGNRRSEVLALLIDSDIPEYARNEDRNVILWAISKSIIPFSQKDKLLIKYCDLKSMESAIEIAGRMDSPQIIRGLLKKLEKIKSRTQKLYY